MTENSSKANTLPFNPSDVVVKQESDDINILDAYDDIANFAEELCTTIAVDEDTKTKKKSEKKKRKPKSTENEDKKNKTKKGESKKRSKNEDVDEEPSKKKKSDEEPAKKKRKSKKNESDEKKTKKDSKKKTKKEDTDDEEETPKKTKRQSKPRAKREKLEPFPGFKMEPGIGAMSLKCSGFKRVDPETTQQVAAEIETIQNKLQKAFEKLDTQFKGIDHSELMTFYNYIGVGDMFKEYIEFLKIENMFPAVGTAAPSSDDIVPNYNEITKSIEHSREVKNAMKQKSKAQSARPTTSVKVPLKQALNSQIKQAEESDSESSSNDSEYESD